MVVMFYTGCDFEPNMQQINDDLLCIDVITQSVICHIYFMVNIFKSQ